LNFPWALNSSSLFLLLWKRYITCTRKHMWMKLKGAYKSRVNFALSVWFLINVQLKTNSVVEHSSDGVTRSRHTDEGFSQGLSTWPPQARVNHNYISCVCNFSIWRVLLWY
jgi:hypothetical protein